MPCAWQISLAHRLRAIITATGPPVAGRERRAPTATQGPQCYGMPTESWQNIGMMFESVQSDRRPRVDLDIGGLIAFIAPVPAESEILASPSEPYLGSITLAFAWTAWMRRSPS